MAGPEGPEGPAAANVHPLRNRTFLVVWLGQTVSLIGSGISTIAIIWWVYLVTGSTILLATVAIAGTIPRLIAGPLRVPMWTVGTVARSYSYWMQ